MAVPGMLAFGKVAAAAAGGSALYPAVAPGIAAVLSKLMAHPLWGAVLGSIGTKALRGFLGPELPYGEFAQEQLQAMSEMLPELRGAAAGQETAGSRAIKQQVQTEGTRMQQSYAQGARRAGLVGALPGGTAPYRAQQGRVQVGMQQAMTERLGAYQGQAQQTLAGMAPTALQHAGITQMADVTRGEDFMGALARFNREYQQNQFDPEYQEMLTLLKQLLFKTVGTPTTPATPTAGLGELPAPTYYG